MANSKLWAVPLLFVSLLPQAFADGDQIQGLALDPSDFVIRVENAGFPSQKVIATLKGSVEGENRSLIDTNRNVVLATLTDHSTKTFELPVILTSSNTEVLLLAVDASGAVERKTFSISYPSYEGTVSASGEVSSLGQNWGFALGTDFINYSETTLTSFSEVFLNAKLSYQRPIGNKWDVAINSSLDLVPLGTSVEGQTLRFFRANGRVGYSLLRSDRWSLSLAGGLFYTTSFTSETFGFKNLLGPQLFPIVRYSLGPRDSLGLYFKYSPITGTNQLSFVSYEEVVGLNWTRALPNKKTFNVSAEWTRDFVHLTDYALQVDASSVNLAVGYGF